MSDEMSSINTRVVVVCPPVLEGGVLEHIREMYPAMSSKGLSIRVLIPESSELELAGCEVHGLPKSRVPPETYGFSMDVLRVIREHCRDSQLIHVHGYPTFPADFLTMFKDPHVALLVTAHGSIHQTSGLAERVMKRIHNAAMFRLLSRIDCIIAISGAERQALLDVGIPQEKIQVSYNGVSSDYLELNRNATSGTTRILYLGRLARSKNLDVLVDAFKMVRSVADCELVLAGGNWGIESELRAKVMRMGLSSCVQIVGFVSSEEKMRLLSTSSVFVHSSLQDVFSISVLEASAAGLPIVAFDTPGMREVVEVGKTGLLAIEPTASSLAESILRLVESSSLRDELGHQGRQFVRSRFSWASATESLLEIYCQILNRPRS